MEQVTFPSYGQRSMMLLWAVPYRTKSGMIESTNDVKFVPTKQERCYEGHTRVPLCSFPGFPALWWRLPDRGDCPVIKEVSPYIYNDLSLIPGTPVKRPGYGEKVGYLTTSEAEILGYLEACWPARLAKPPSYRLGKGHYLKDRVECDWGWLWRSTFGFHVHIPTCACILTHVCLC